MWPMVGHHGDPAKYVPNLRGSVRSPQSFSLVSSAAVRYNSPVGAAFSRLFRAD
jgi:hypothetical protein